jgi:hypothetical protein
MIFINTKAEQCQAQKSSEESQWKGDQPWSSRLFTQLAYAEVVLPVLQQLDALTMKFVQ